MTRWIAEFVILVNHQTMQYKIPLEASDGVDAAKELKSHEVELQDVKGFVVMSKKMTSVTEEEYFSPDHYSDTLRYHPVQSHAVHHSDDEDEAFKCIERDIQKDAEKKREEKSTWQRFTDWLSRYFCCHCASTPEKKGYVPVDLLQQAMEDDPLLADLDDDEIFNPLYK